MKISNLFGPELYCITFVVCLTQAFYKLPDNLPSAVVEIPSTNEELKSFLCDTEKGGRCFDTTPRIIRITKVFDFRNLEGNATEEGCYHLSTPVCKERGQQKLNVNDQCKGLELVQVTYDKAGRTPLLVGSNKYIVGEKGAAGILGKGLSVYNAHDVVISGLNITDINPHLIWGGDAITLNNATNVWIDNNYIARIGRQMLVTGFGQCQQITVSNNEFDGKTPYAAYCDGAHYWLWLFLGSNDTITLINNYVHDTSGRGPHSTGMNNASVLLHMINNRFENISHAGLIESYDTTSRILVEGNNFSNVSKIISLNLGQIFFSKDETDVDTCEKYIGRKCLLNEVNLSNKYNTTNDLTVLEELQNYNLINSCTINKQQIQFQIMILLRLLSNILFPPINETVATPNISLFPLDNILS